MEKSEKNYTRVFSIDAGRKYFSVEQLKQIIRHAAESRFTDVQLILGNDGLRFILDDMSVIVDGNVYDSDDVREGIVSGNYIYYDDPNGTYLTENDMSELVDYAKEVKIRLIPLINSPGHMDAILTAMENLGIISPNFNGSKRTVDLANNLAVSFTKKLIAKYVDYFSRTGVVRYFNLGNDEYANDVDLGGWDKLQESGLYKNFIFYVNELALIVKKSGLIPISFNDGIYYNSNDRMGNFDRDIVIAYWTDGEKLASPQFFGNKGHKILNTDNKWYFVLGRETPADGVFSYIAAMENSTKVKLTDIDVGVRSDNLLGGMQAVWADEPSKTYAVRQIFSLMDRFSKNS